MELVANVRAIATRWRIPAANDREQLTGAVATFPCGQPVLKLEGKLDVFDRRTPGQERVTPRHVPDVGTHARHLLAADHEPSSCRRDQAGDQIQER